MVSLKSLWIAVVFQLCLITTSAFAEYDMRWYRNEMICETVKVTVLSYCKNDADERANTFCVQQKLILENQGKKKIKNNLLEKEPSRNDFHSVRSLTCVKAKNDKPYLFLSLGNGGNCDACEVSATMDLNGKWKRYDRRWYTSGDERKVMTIGDEKWWRQDSFFLINKTEVLEK
jgi:hypothetical protein